MLNPPSLALSLLLALGAAGCRSATPQPPPPPVEEASVKPGANDDFVAQDLDVADYVRLFEGESREIAVHRDALVEVLDLRPGVSIADVGSGTGLFLEPLAEGVGPTGRVYSVDISPGFIEHLTMRAEAAGYTQVEPVLCGERSVDLPEGSVDVVFVCDTYHHFEYPRSTLHSIYRAMRPGAVMVVVDFERIPGVTREWLLDHVRADKQTFQNEIVAAGFVFEEEVEVEGLDENYVLRFRRP